MPNLSDMEYIFSSRQGPMTHHLYELHMGLRDVGESSRIGEYEMNFDSLDMVYSERRRQRPRYLINLKRAPNQPFSIASVTDLQLEGRLDR